MRDSEREREGGRTPGHHESEIEERDRERDRARQDGFRLQAPEISLPKGGGAVRSIDEKFAVNPSNGTASLSLPLPFSPGRNAVTPAVRLSYDSGQGNGIAGLGWSLDLPSIRRRTERQLPRYRDEDDVFVLAGAEDLVPAWRWEAGQWKPDLEVSGLYSVRRYRPRIEAAFSRIERISHPSHGTWWRVTTRDDFTTLYGLDAASRIVDPGDSARIFQWLPALAFDNLGNCVVYQHQAEDLVGVPDVLAERNRKSGLAGFANQHLKRVKYGNRIPYFAADSDPYRPPAPTGDFLFEAVFDYGEHDAARPTPAKTPGLEWKVRADPFSSYRSSFDVRTYRLLERVLMFHRFDELAGGEPCLVRSLDLGHQSSSAGSPQASQVTYLTSATQSGYHRLASGDYSKKSLPAVELEYQPLSWDAAVRSVEPDSVANLPAGVEAAGAARWLDLYGEGIAGAFTEQASGWYYKANLGDLGEQGRLRLDHQRLVARKPSFLGIAKGSLRLEDLDNDGARQMVVESPELRGWFELGAGEDWTPFQSFPAVLRLDLDDRNLKRLDLDGDGRADVMISEEQAFVCYSSEGKGGFSPLARTAKPRDEERGAAVIFADSAQSIFLADMTGDGLSDIVRIRNRDICYWPNLGYGRFGPRVTMDNAPLFDHPDRFNPDYLVLADVSGTGLTDLIYLGRGDCRAYLNLNGNGWSDAQPIAPFLPAERPTRVSAADLLGNGTTCLVWSSPLPAHAGAPLRYVDLMAGRKPHLLRKYVNNLGKEVTLSYKSSTWFYLKDKVEGRPWITKLPFPVHCLRRVETRDGVGGARFVNDYRYHHGYFDRAEREFRGFGMVEQTDSEQYEHWAQGAASNIVAQPHHQPPVLRRTWYHTGAHLDRERILTQFRDEYWDREMARQGFAAEAAVAAEPELPDGRVVAAPDIDPNTLAGLGFDEQRQALRACKGMALRTELFALDAPAAGATPAERLRELSPYVATTHNCVIEVLQPALGGAPAVFLVKESEAVTWRYDRALADPRVEHRLNLRVDALGEVLESATIAYGRSIPDGDLPAAVAADQGRTWISYRRTAMTNDAVSPAHHRLRRPSEASEWELRGLAKSAKLYQVTDFVSPTFDVLAASVEVPFHHSSSDPPAGVIQRRLLFRKQTVFYDDAAEAALPLHGLGFRGLPFENYLLAYTPELVTDVFGGKATPAMLGEAKYIHRGDSSWWARSGRSEYRAAGETEADARARFFVPISHIDGHGARTRVRYFAGYCLLVEETEDAALNRNRVDAFDLRLLQPRRTVDANDNVTECWFDELGLVKARARLGKGSQGDDLAGLTAWNTAAEDADVAAFFASASSTELTTRGQALVAGAGMRFLYDLHRYQASGGVLPAVAATVLRERHAAAGPSSPVQIVLEYSNGLGAVALVKGQAEPGVAKGIDTRTLDPVQPRWVGSGRKVLSNKGKPVKEYDPYFSLTHQFESDQDLAELGFTPISTFDAAGRLLRVDYPDGTFQRKDYGSWRTALWDRNDTAPESVWYQRRVSHSIDAELAAVGKHPAREEEAAHATEAHAGTPETSHLDALGRVILKLEHNGRDSSNQPVLYPTRSRRDVEGHLLEVTDPRDNPAMSFKYDLTGRTAFHHGMDDGGRWVLGDITGQPVRTWDDRGHVHSFTYADPLHRLTAKHVAGGDDSAPLDHVFERRIYGEGAANDKARNLRGRVAVVYDLAGKTENLSFDFKGNLAESVRRLAHDYRRVPSWSGPNPDALLDDETFTSSALYDARDRVVERSTPDGSVYRPTYNEANLLETVAVTQGATTRLCVKDIDYDALGRRERVRFGNDVSVAYAYDRETRRLVTLTTRRHSGGALQDFHYTYDAAGNLTHLEDRCVPTVWFGNQMITGLATYQYDAVYRLVHATGREHPGQLAGGAADNWDDQPFLERLSANDPMVWRAYAQTYHYDAAGNLKQVEHVAPPTGSWTRDYDYAAQRNRLVSTQRGGTTYSYQHHSTHGFMTSMPHLSVMRSNFRDELQATATQVVTSGTPETTWYVYDGDGKRVRKVTDRSAAVGEDAVKKAERIYLDGVEIYREYGQNGGGDSERRTFHVMDDRQRIAMIERHFPASGPADPTLVRYQGPDHLGSARLETDEDGRVISYEEFHPFGTTAYQAVDSGVQAAAKRYRFTEMERDEESGLEHHGARYYVPWLGRWTAPDKQPERLTGNRYAYVKNNPVVHTDLNGMFEEPVHGATCFRLLVAAGFSVTDAGKIAIANAAMDHDKGSATAGTDMMSKEVNQKHFSDFQQALAPIEAAKESLKAERDDKKGEDARLISLGQNLHRLEDVGFKEAPGPHMRGTKELSTFFYGFGGWFMGLTTALIVGGAADPATDKSGWAIAALITFTLGAILISIGGHMEGFGHGTYTSERGETSYWIPPAKNVNDQAYQDPGRPEEHGGVAQGNTKLLRMEFEHMMDLAEAHTGVKIDRVAARKQANQIIEDVVTADNTGRINALMNADVGGGVTYASLLGKARPDGKPSWTVKQIDVSDFSEATQARVRARNEVAEEKYQYRLDGVAPP